MPWPRLSHVLLSETSMYWLHALSAKMHSLHFVQPSAVYSSLTGIIRSPASYFCLADRGLGQHNVAVVAH